MFRKAAIFIVLAAILVGCAGPGGDDTSPSSQTSSYNAQTPIPRSSASRGAPSDQFLASSPGGGGKEEGGGAAPVSEQPQERAQIRGVALAMRVEKLDEAERKISAAIKESGGFEQNLSSSDLSGPNAMLTIQAKVPVEKVDDVVAQIEGLGTRLSKSVSMNDVTNEIAYDDIKLKARKQQQNLLLNKKDLTPEERERLNELTIEKNAIETEREAKARQAALATLNLTLRQGAVAAGSDQDPNWLAQSYGQSSSAAVALFRVVATAFLWVLFMSPFYLPFVVVGWLVYRAHRKKMGNTPPRQPNAPPAATARQMP